MKFKIHFSLLTVCLSVILLAVQNRAPFVHQKPGHYLIPEYVKPARLRPADHLELLMPAARTLVQQWVHVSSKHSVLLVSDSSVSPLVTAAIRQAVLEAKPRKITTIMAPLPSEESELYSANWWTQEIWDEVEKNDLILTLAFINPDTVTVEGQRLSEFLRGHGSTLWRITSQPQLLVSDWAFFPKELFLNIARGAAQEVRRGSTFRMRDKAGTDISGTYEPAQIADYEPHSPIQNFPPQYEVSLCPKQATVQKGRIAAHSSGLGFFPFLSITLRGNRVTSWQGGGGWAEYFRGLAQEGSYTLSQIRWGMVPKAFRYTDGSTFSPALYGQLAGSQRAGSVRVLFQGTRKSRFAPAFDLQVYYPDVEIDSQVVVKEGYPLVLHSPGIRTAAMNHPGFLVQDCTPVMRPRGKPKSPRIVPVTDRKQVTDSLQTLVEKRSDALGQKGIVVLTDPTLSPLLRDALQDALKDRPDLEIRPLPFPDRFGEPVQFLAWLQSRAPLRFKETTGAVLNLAFGESHALAVPPQPPVPWLDIIPVPEILTWVAWRDFPDELQRAIWNREKNLLDTVTSISVSDRRGSSLILSDVKVNPRFDVYEKCLVTLPPSSFISVVAPSINGIFVSSRIQSGAVEPITAKVSDNKIRSVSGRGPLVDLLNQLLGEGKSIVCREVRWYHNPKAFSYVAGDSKGSPSLWGEYAGSLRAGVVHLIFTEEQTRLTLDFVSYFTDVVGIGEHVVEDFVVDGSLRSLELPEIAKVAGDQALLEVDYVPDLSATSP